MALPSRATKQVAASLVGVALLAAACFLGWQNERHGATTNTVPRTSTDTQHASEQTADRTAKPERNNARPPLVRHSVVKSANESSKIAPSQQAAEQSATDEEAEHKKRIADAFEQMVHDDGKHVFQAPGVSAQAMFEKEAADPSWAPAATQEIQNHLADSLGDRFDVSMVDCRSDICEIRATGQPNGNAMTDTSYFQDSWTSQQSQNWFSQAGFDDHIVTVSNVDGVPMFVVFLSRQ